jgi:hypothetical protein
MTVDYRLVFAENLILLVLFQQSYFSTIYVCIYFIGTQPNVFSIHLYMCVHTYKYVLLILSLYNVY